MAYCGGGAGAGAGAGNRGGGLIKLYAKYGMIIKGTITTQGNGRVSGNGLIGGNASGNDGGDGGNGGRASYSGESRYGNGGVGTDCNATDGGNGGRGGYGGRGAGGGILLYCAGPWGILVTGTLNTAGGYGLSGTLYGSCKIFGLKGRIDLSAATLSTGHEGSGGYGSPLIDESLHWVHPVC